MSRAMTDAAAVPTIETYLTVLIDEGVNAGLPVPEACLGALDKIKRDDRANEVLAEIGVRALSDFWWRRQHAQRSAFRRVEPGERKVNAQAVNRPEAIFEIHEYIGGKAVRLGDLTAEQCRELAESRRLLAKSNQRASDVFAKIIKRWGSKKSETVRDAYRNRVTELVKLYRSISDE